MTIINSQPNRTSYLRSSSVVTRDKFPARSRKKLIAQLQGFNEYNGRDMSIKYSNYNYVFYPSDNAGLIIKAERLRGSQGSLALPTTQKTIASVRNCIEYPFDENGNPLYHAIEVEKNVHEDQRAQRIINLDEVAGDIIEQILDHAAAAKSRKQKTDSQMRAERETRSWADGALFSVPTVVAPVLLTIATVLGISIGPCHKDEPRDESYTKPEITNDDEDLSLLHSKERTGK